MYKSESSSPSRVTLALGLPSDRHRLLGGTVACVLFGEVVYLVGTSGLAQSLVPHFFARLIWTWVHPPDVDTHSGMQLDPIKPARPVSPGSAGQASLTSHTWLGRLTWLSRRPRLRGSGAASGAQALHQQDQRSAQARCRKTAFFLHARFFYILSTHHP